MKKTLTLIIVLAFIFPSLNAQKLSKIAPKIIAIGIGEKNPTFDESMFPDIDIYYTPNIIINDYGMSDAEWMEEYIKVTTIPFYKSKKMVGDPLTGTPQFIIDANSYRDRGITSFYMLFDSEGLCYTFGYDGSPEGMSDELKDVVKKGKTIKPAKKPYGFEKKQVIVGHKLGDFSIQSIEGNTLELNTLLGKEPVLVIFFQLDSGWDAGAQELSVEEGSSLSVMEQTNYEMLRKLVYDVTEPLRSAEREFFDMKFERYK